MTAKKKSIVCVVLSALLLPLGAQQRQTLKIATIAPSRSAWDVSQRRLAQDWATASGNTITMQFMSANAMGGESGVIQKLNAVRPGQKAPIDGAIFTSIGIAELAPETQIMTLAVPFLFRNQEEVDIVLDAFTGRLQAAITAKGYVILGWFNVGWAYFYTKRPAHTIAELKQQRMSVSGLGLPGLTNAFKAAGFQTHGVAADKLLQSTRTPGGVEAIYTIPMYGYAGQFYKSLPYILDVPICPVMAAFVISEASWNAIPDAYKPALLAAMRAAEADFIAAQRSSDSEYLQRCVDGGSTLVKPNAAELRLMQETLERDAVAMIQTGIMDQAFYDDIRAVLKRHRGE
ncbi:MAG: TRAP transporter substrate-binding protein DctP [Treponema sp.]|nr:TRAP transporter substrate-binding protein DctP [Treponema sp.]